jgi:hypothetical protein
MAAYVPFNNGNYQKIFSVRSTDTREIVELYKRSNYYVLYRYNENGVTSKCVNKFTEVIQVEIIDEITKMSLYLTTNYNNSAVIHRFNACCGNKLYVNNVETEIYRHLF